MDTSKLVQIPRVMIAGTHSGVGKTTIATGIMAALTSRGLPLQAYKVGPDYIDPSYHALATGRPSRNLDRWLLRDNLLAVFEGTAQGSWAVIEGVMGLFDGVSGTQGYGSSADIAKLLEVPVILVVDAGNLSRSVAALVHGFCTFDPDLKIAGVIFNRVKSPAQETLLRDALQEIKVPILGVLPKEEGIRLPERHLGLVPSQENSFQEGFFEDLIQVITHHINLDKLQEIMLTHQGDSRTECQVSVKPSLGLTNFQKKLNTLQKEDALNSFEEDYQYKINLSKTMGKGRLLRLGVAWDEVFSFYYQDALDYAERVGFTLVTVSPLHDSSLPNDLDALFMGGGFPELHLKKLSSNKKFLASLREFADSGKTIYAECGGYMYLGQRITDFAGETYPMAGLVPIQAKMTKKLQGMGYRKGIFQGNNFLGRAGTEVYGHEFHYSAVEFMKATDASHYSAYELYKGGQAVKIDGYAKDNIFASYLHLNFAGHPQLLERWVEYIRQGANG